MQLLQDRIMHQPDHQAISKSILGPLGAPKVGTQYGQKRKWFANEAGFGEMRRVGKTHILVRPPTLLAPGPVENRASAPHRALGVSFATGRAFRRNTRWRQQKIPPGW